MKRSAFLAAGAALTVAPTALAKRARGDGFKTIPYRPSNTDPYYDPVFELRAKHVDARIWPAVQAINKSGWVWTAESCEGHRLPSRNQLQDRSPWLRLVCRDADSPAMLDALIRSAPHELGYSGLEVVLQPSPPGWFEVRVYVRRGGVSVFKRFARSIQ